MATRKNKMRLEAELELEQIWFEAKLIAELSYSFYYVANDVSRKELKRANYARLARLRTAEMPHLKCGECTTRQATEEEKIKYGITV
jgi:hypothetical protein